MRRLIISHDMRRLIISHGMRRLMIVVFVFCYRLRIPSGRPDTAEYLELRGFLIPQTLIAAERILNLHLNHPNRPNTARHLEIHYWPLWELCRLFLGTQTRYFAAARPRG